MSRTRRTKRPQLNWWALKDKQYKDGKVRDGTPTHSSSSCERNGGCPYCEDNRAHSTRKREPIIEQDYNIEEDQQ